MTTNWPAPEVPARVAEAVEVPRGALLIQRRAQAVGWAVVATYARGTAPRREPRVIDSLALHLRRERMRAVGLWLDGKFDLAFAWGEHPVRRCNATQLRAVIGGEPAPVPPTLPALARAAPPKPAALPLPLGAVWGRVHIGDTVRGADQRPWRVTARGRATRWVDNGDQARFTLYRDDRHVNVARYLAEPVDVIARADHSETYHAVEVLLHAGINIELIEEQERP